MMTPEAMSIIKFFERRCVCCALPLSLHFCHCIESGHKGPMPDSHVNRPIFARTNDPERHYLAARGK